MFDHASAIGRWGPIFLELMQVPEVTPGTASRVHGGAAGGSKLGHIAYVVDYPAAASERLEAAGMPKVLDLRQGPIRIAMHDAPLLGHAIEVHQKTEAIHELFALFAAGAEGWDGGEPLRPWRQADAVRSGVRPARAGAYRRRIENRIRAGNITRP